MILQLLSLLAFAGDHANLHPAEADLYMCVPEVQGAITASDAVGLRRLLKDPDIVKFFGEELELPGALSIGGESVDLPEEAIELLWGSVEDAWSLLDR